MKTKHHIVVWLAIGCVVVGVIIILANVQQKASENRLEWSVFCNRESTFARKNGLRFVESSSLPVSNCVARMGADRAWPWRERLSHRNRRFCMKQVLESDIGGPISVFVYGKGPDIHSIDICHDSSTAHLAENFRRALLGEVSGSTKIEAVLSAGAE